MATPEEKAAAKAAKKIEGDSVVVRSKHGEREFSREVHGDEFAERATEFAQTHDGEIVQ